MTIIEHFIKVRTTTEKICEPLQVEDYVPLSRIAGISAAK